MAKHMTYQSPFTWRYGSSEMRHLWSEEQKRKIWRRLWVTLAEVQAEFGLVTGDQVSDLRAHADEVDMDRALEIEAEVRHDLMSELQVFAAQAPVGAPILHQGATSMDIKDNAEVLQMGAALDLLTPKLVDLLAALTRDIDRWADTPLIAFTHLQPAEPSTLGYRLAQYAQDLHLDWVELGRIRAGLRGKGFRGAVGTGASFAQLVGLNRLNAFEARLEELLDLPGFPVSTQTYPRKQDYVLVSALAGLGGSLYKFAFDLRLLQSPLIGEWQEPFGERQVGSSAMPFKRNPIQAEKIDSLARMLAQLPRLAWDNAAHSLLERTLDDSANRRVMLPEAFLICDELLETALGIVTGLQVHASALQRNLETYAPFAATERVLLALVAAGADRQAMHARLRGHAHLAWETVQRGEPNPLSELIRGDPRFQAYLSEDELVSLMPVDRYLGDAPLRARALAAAIREDLGISDG